jgi:hypothetical protein
VHSAPKIAARSLAFGVLLVVMAARCTRGDAVRGLDGDVLRSAAEIVIDDASDGALPLAEPRAVLAGSGDRTIVLDAVPPFLRVYDHAGALVGAAALKGSGPGELSRPGFGAVRGDTLWIADFGTGRAVFWTLDGPDELGREDLPTGVVAFVTGCGDRLLAVYRGRTETVSRYGILALESEGWGDRSGLSGGTGEFTPTWPDFRAVATDNGIYLYDWFNSRIQSLACDGSVRAEVDVAYPPEWKLSPKPSGMALVREHVVLFFTDRPDRSDDHTRIAVWTPGAEGVAQRTVPGDWRLHGTHGQRVWLVDNRRIPTVLGVPVDEFLQWLKL